MLDEVRGRCPTCANRLCSTTAGMPLLNGAQSVSTTDLETLENSLQFDDAINIQYTSGTTGFPKGATLSHHNILNNGLLYRRSVAPVRT